VIIDAEGSIGDVVALEEDASKGKGGRIVPLNKELKAASTELKVFAAAKRIERGFPFYIRENPKSPSSTLPFVAESVGVKPS
jgi:hypothetical protein